MAVWNNISPESVPDCFFHAGTGVYTESDKALQQKKGLASKTMFVCGLWNLFL